MLELISKSRKQPSAPKGSDDGESGGACDHISKKRKGRQAEQFFDLEAALSGRCHNFLCLILFGTFFIYF